MSEAECIAQRLAREYELRYSESVNLQGAVQNAIFDGLSPANAEKFARDMLESLLGSPIHPERPSLPSVGQILDGDDDRL